MADTITERGAPPLVDLCVKELLAKVLGSETPDVDFINLELGVRVLLFSRLKTEILQMKEVKPKWQSVIGMNPYIDNRIHLIPGRSTGFGNPIDNFPVINQWSYETEHSDSEEEDDEDEETSEEEGDEDEDTSEEEDDKDEEMSEKI
jgi:hypothetical protein